MAQSPQVVSANANEEDTIDLLQLAAAIWHNAIYVILAAIIGGIIAMAASVILITPKYSATATLFVNTSSVSLGSTSISLSSSSLNAANTMVDIYITILESRETLQEVAEEAGIEYNYEKLSKAITAESSDASGIFTVTVESTSPTEAELIANTIAAVLPNRIADIVDGTSTRVVEYAVVPTARSSPSYAKNTVIGALIGIVLSCAVIIVIDLVNTSRDTNIHSVEELKALYPDIPVLATIADMRHTGGKSGYGYGYGYYEQKQPEKKNSKKQKPGKNEKKTKEEKGA